MNFLIIIALLLVLCVQTTYGSCGCRMRSKCKKDRKHVVVTPVIRNDGRVYRLSKTCSGAITIDGLYGDGRYPNDPVVVSIRGKYKTPAFYTPYNEDVFITGPVVNGLFHGEVTIVYGDKTRKTTGTMKEGKFDGNVELYSYGEPLYKGSFSKGKYNGHGVNMDRDISTGNYINGYLEGKGTRLYKTGDLYEGEFRRGEPYGKGTFTYKNGDRFDGFFKGNIYPAGKGVYSYANGAKYEGSCNNGYRHGYGVLTSPKGTRQNRLWVYNFPLL